MYIDLYQTENTFLDLLFKFNNSATLDKKTFNFIQIQEFHSFSEGGCRDIMIRNQVDVFETPKYFKKILLIFY